MDINEAIEHGLSQAPDPNKERLTGLLNDILGQYGIHYVDEVDQCHHQPRGLRITILGMDAYEDVLAAERHVRGTSTYNQDFAPKRAYLLCRSVNLPSEVRQQAERREAIEKRQAARQAAAADRLTELKEAGETIFRCGECEGVFGEDELIQVRECPAESCQTEYFDGTNNGRNCDECNRPFTRKVHDRGCPECDPSEAECDPYNDVPPRAV